MQTHPEYIKGIARHLGLAVRGTIPDDWTHLVVQFVTTTDLCVLAIEFEQTPAGIDWQRVPEAEEAHKINNAVKNAQDEHWQIRPHVLFPDEVAAKYL